MNKEELENYIEEVLNEYNIIPVFNPLKVYLSDKLPQEAKEFCKEYFRNREIVWCKPIKFVKGDEK